MVTVLEGEVSGGLELLTVKIASWPAWARPVCSVSDFVVFDSETWM